jgi:hypothetical protein
MMRSTIICTSLNIMMLTLCRMIKAGHLPWIRVIRVTRSTNRVLVRKPEGQRSRRRCMSKWHDNIKMDLKQTGRAWRDSSGSGLGRLAGSCEHNNEH